MLSNSHAPPQPTAAQLQQRQMADAQERELAKRRSRKPTDKNVPDGVEEVVLGDGVQQYKELRDLERRLDAAMMRKRLDVQDAVNRNVKRYKTLRIWISNTAENQPWQARGLDENAFDFSTGIEATYKVKIEGRLLDDEDEDGTDAASDSEDEGDKEQDQGENDADAMDHDGQEGPASKKRRASPISLPRKKLSHFFKSITVEFDRSKTLQPDSTTHIEWKKPPTSAPNPPPAADFDSLEFERKSDENINITINLVRDENPERFKLSKELAEVLDTEEEDRAGVVMGIWEYVKIMGLQEDEERRGIRCDDALRAVFKQDHVFFPQVPDLIWQQNHLLPLPPIRLPYTIRVDPAFQSNESSQIATPTATNQSHRTPEPTIYDIRVPLDDPLRARMSALISLNSSMNPSYTATLRNIAQHDDNLAMIVQAITHSKAKHGFFTAMSKDPAGFVKRWTSSQRRDLEVILGESTAAGAEEGAGQTEEWRRGGDTGVWGAIGVRESVGLLLARGK
ncbi:MAG: hypothetical protein M4579_000935 [Chaenotheca gracillima]|nr:MAG: hypothetical protein M4579_000935 [Chaenotheca gracillima]